MRMQEQRAWQVWQSRRLQGSVVTEEAEEDAWVNDVGPFAYSSARDVEEEQTVPLLAAYAGAACSQEYIGPGHPLWSLVQRLSERIWRERRVQLGQGTGQAPEDETLVATQVRKRVKALLQLEPRWASVVRSRGESALLTRSVLDEVLGCGPLEALLKDESLTEILAVGARLMYVELDGQMQEIPPRFASSRHMLRIIENMLHRAGLSLQAGCSLVDFYLPDGSYVNLVLSTGATNGPTILIRKRSRKLLTMADLVERRVLSQAMADTLLACVRARRNIVICGHIGSGRTTLLNALATCIPTTERIVTIEETSELRLEQRHAVSLVAPLGAAHVGASDVCTHERVHMRDLVQAALHMRPDWLIVGECRGDETAALFSAMHAGYDGALTTLYANNPRDAIARLETLFQLEEHTVPIPLIREQIASALNIIIYTARLRDGSYKIMEIVEVQGLEHDAVKLKSLFRYSRNRTERM